MSAPPKRVAASRVNACGMLWRRCLNLTRQCVQPRPCSWPLHLCIWSPTSVFDVSGSSGRLLLVRESRRGDLSTMTPWAYHCWFRPSSHGDKGLHVCLLSGLSAQHVSCVMLVVGGRISVAISGSTTVATSSQYAKTEALSATFTPFVRGSWSQYCLHLFSDLRTSHANSSGDRGTLLCLSVQRVTSPSCLPKDVLRVSLAEHFAMYEGNSGASTAGFRKQVCRSTGHTALL